MTFIMQDFELFSKLIVNKSLRRVSSSVADLLIAATIEVIEHADLSFALNSFHYFQSTRGL